jgi:hypothetical protein
MRDVVFVAVTIGFFAVCVAYVNACARIIGRDSSVELDTEPEAREARR